MIAKSHQADLIALIDVGETTKAERSSGEGAVQPENGPIRGNGRHVAQSGHAKPRARAKGARTIKGFRHEKARNGAFLGGLQREDMTHGYNCTVIPDERRMNAFPATL